MRICRPPRYRSVPGITQGIEPAKGPSPQAARAPFALQLTPAFYGGSVRLEPPIHKLPAPNHHPSIEMRHPADQHLGPHTPLTGHGQLLPHLFRKSTSHHRSVLTLSACPLPSQDGPVEYQSTHFHFFRKGFLSPWFRPGCRFPWPRHLPDDPYQPPPGTHLPCHRFGIAAPAVVRWIFHHPGPHWIQVNISRHRP